VSTSQTTEFLADEVMRIGESMKHPHRQGEGIKLMDADMQRRITEQFLEYSMELARRFKRRVGR
jgi:hypothetical protein